MRATLIHRVNATALRRSRTRPHSTIAAEPGFSDTANDDRHPWGSRRAAFRAAPPVSSSRRIGLAPARGPSHRARIVKVLRRIARALRAWFDPFLDGRPAAPAEPPGETAKPVPPADRRELGEHNLALAGAVRLRQTLATHAAELERQQAQLETRLEAAAQANDNAGGSALALRWTEVKAELEKCREELARAQATVEDLTHAREAAIRRARVQASRAAGRES